MPIDRNAVCSDLVLARETSRKLRGLPAASSGRGSSTGGGHGESGTFRATHRYVRFQLGKVIEAESHGPSTSRGATTASWGSDHWNQLLDEAMDLSGAESAFLMDEHGLVIGVRGRADAETAELLGAHITVTFQQADRMRLHEGGVTTICVDLRHSWLNGIKCRLDGGGALVLGMLAGAAIQDEQRDGIAQLVLRAAQVLR